MSNLEIIPMENRSYVKSNEMISSKYKSSLLENQVMAIALTRIEVSNDIENPLQARLYPGELKRLVSDDAHIYRDLKKLAKSITGHTMFLEDGKGNFKAFSVVPNAEYIDGVFTIKFNSVIKEHIFNLPQNKKPFTSLEISVMTSFKKNSSFRIYELLKKDLFRSDPKVNGGRVDVEYNLFEFRFMIGIANADNTEVRKYIDSVPVVDWEVAYHILEEKGSRSDVKFKTTDKLQSDCLKPAQKELEEKSDLKFEYELQRIGRPYKKIIFHIYKNKPKNEPEIVERQQYVKAMNKKNRQLEIPMDIYRGLYDDFVGHNELSKEDIDLLIMRADGDERKVRKAIELADKAPEIRNYMGWLVKAIEDDYMNIGTLHGDHESFEEISEIQSEYNNSKESVAEKVWYRYKLKEEFIIFYAETFGDMPLASIELAYSAMDLCDMFVKWQENRGKKK